MGFLLIRKQLLSVEIAKDRIAYRVAHGGHGIPDADVERKNNTQISVKGRIKGNLYE